MKLTLIPVLKVKIKKVLTTDQSFRPLSETTSILGHYGCFLQTPVVLLIVFDIIISTIPNRRIS